jgi:DNA-binding transcriptional ArsR family regulator
LATSFDAGSAFAAIARAHARFHQSALSHASPDLTGVDREDVLERERDLGESYLTNARSRLNHGFGDIDAEAPEASLQAQGLLARERRFLDQHLAAAGNRLLKAGDVAELAAAGETHGVWVLDESKKTHTRDCEMVANRLWPLDFLREFLLTRHGGCGCRAISRTEAVRRGIDVRRGVLTARKMHAMLNEADATPHVVRVPILGSDEWEAGRHPRGTHGRFVAVTHNLHPAFHPAIKEIAAALGRGDVDGAEFHSAEARQLAAHRIEHARSEKDWEDASEQMDHLERVMTRVVSAAVEPERERGGGIPINERVGITEPWASGGRFAWAFPRGVLPDPLVKLISEKRMESFRVGRSGDDIVLVSTSKDKALARAATREMEGKFPRLRNHRVTSPGQAFDDDRPLDRATDERSEETRDPMSVYAGVTGKQLGDSGEILLNAAAQRLRELGLSSGPEEIGYPGARDGSPLDWTIDNLGIEVKTIPLRGYTPGVMAPSPKITGAQSEVKQADLIARNAARRAAGRSPMHAAQVQVFADYDNDVGHMFVHLYPDTGSQFGSLRVPKEAVDSLIGEGLDPGQAFTASRGAFAGDPDHAWIFLGSVRLPVNPLFSAYQGRRIPAEERRSLTALDPRFVDTGVPEGFEYSAPEKVPAPLRKPSKEELRSQLVHLYHHGRHESGRQLTLGEIGEHLGVSQPTVSRWLKDAGITTGKGARRDQPPPETKQEAISRLSSEGRSPAEIAKSLRVTRTLVDRVLGLEDSQLTRGEVAESEGDPSSSPEVPPLRLVS